MFSLLGRQKEKQNRKQTFKEVNSYADRIKLLSKFQQRYPKDRYALIVLEGIDEFQPSSKGFCILGVENHFTILMLMEYVRLKILKVHSKESFFLKVRSQIRRTSDNLGELFKRYAEQDGFLYVQIKKENIF